MNTFSLICNLPKPIREWLDDNYKNVLDGIPYRLMFEGNISLVKIIPNFHNGAIRRNPRQRRYSTRSNAL
jgi:hypothetical protein